MIQAQQLRDNAQYRNMLLQSNMRNQEEMMKWRIAEAQRQARQDERDYNLDAQRVAQGWANVENNKNKANSGRVMPASSATGLSGTQQGINQMSTLMEQIPKFAKLGLAGPVGSLRRFNPYDADAQAFQQYVNTYKQVIGKGLEGGVLRKEDEAKYEKIIPRMGDTEEVLMRKAQQLQQMLIEKYNTDLEALYNAGYDTGNFSYYGLQSNTGNGKSGVTKSGVKYEVIE
jgi:vacuolar-type H+-ATPase subunit H